MTMPERRTPRGKNLAERLIKGGVIATAATLALSACTGPQEVPKSPQIESTQPDLGVEKIPNLEAIRMEKLTREAAHLAQGVVEILADPANGAEESHGNTIGNKSAVIGKDGKFGTADDNPAPDSFMGFAPTSGLLYFNAVNSFPSATVPGESDFGAIQVHFSVGKGNPIRDKSRQLTPEDFQEALEHPDSLSLQYLEASMVPDGQYAPATEFQSADLRQSLRTAPGNETVILISETGTLDLRVGVGDHSPQQWLIGEDEFDGAAQRMFQISHAALKDLKADIS